VKNEDKIGKTGLIEVITDEIIRNFNQPVIMRGTEE
jgi:hypothetical protein